MEFIKMFTTVDTHTGGEPTRTITGGIPCLPGKDMSEKMLYMKENLDYIRTSLMHEPRGHGIMSGAVLTEPTVNEADVGVFYIEVGGYMPMCGHDTIGVATMLVETGRVEVEEPFTEIILDTPAGIVKTKVEVKNGKAESVTFKNVPAFVYSENRKIEFSGKEVNYNICYGGNFYAVISADSLDLILIPENYEAIVTTGNKIKEAINKSVSIQHPEKEYLNSVTHIQFVTDFNKSSLTSKNAVVFPPGAIDRSPCGTGTCARLALLHKGGYIQIGEEFTNYSLIDSVFKGKIVDTIDYYGYQAVIPEITGSAYITGFHNFVLDPDDKKANGFLL